MTLPTAEEIEALHRKYAPSEEAFNSVYIHCQIVADIADQLMTARTFEIDRDVVHAACLLHDIGVYQLYADGIYDRKEYIRHGILGEALLKEEGFPERLCRFCSHHTGVGLSKERIITGGLPLPHEDFLADNEEERLVMYADKFHSKSEPTRFNSADSYKAYVAKFGADNVPKFENMIEHFGLPDLKPLSEKYGHGIV